MNTFNSEEGVLYAEISALANDLEHRDIGISDGGFFDRLSIGYSNASNTIKAFGQVGGVININIGVAVTDIKMYHKVAVSYKNNSLKFYVDGVKIGEQSAPVWGTGVFNSLHFDNGGGTAPFYGNVRAIKVFNRALSSTELEALTTL